MFPLEEEHALAVPRAPVLILDLLSARQAALSAHAICRAGALLGIGESTMRVALTRLCAQGRVARGKRGHYRLVQTAQPLAQAVLRWDKKHALAVAWRAGRWLAVHDSAVPRADKRLHRHHTLALALCGFACLRPGLHLRPDNLRGGVPAHAQRLRQLGLADAALVCTLSHLQAREQAQARALWDAQHLLAADARCIAALQRSAQRLERVALHEAVKESLLLGRHIIAHLLRDPLLPAELMPPATRQQLLALTRAYQERARTLWSRWLARQ